MLHFENGGILIECVEELPVVPPHTELFADFETASGDKTKMSVNPWHDCHALGVGLTWDDHPHAYYVPSGHYQGGNLPHEIVCNWWFKTVNAAQKAWVNSNPKYDAHVSRICYGVEVSEDLEFVDTITHARLIDSDRFQYRLSALVTDWLGRPGRAQELKLKAYLNRNKDYGWVPADMMGEYCCGDVLDARDVWRYIQTEMPPQSAKIAAIETQVTRVLYEAEKRGTCVNPVELKAVELWILEQLTEIQRTLTDMVGWLFRPDANADCYQVLCGTYGIPVLAYTYDKDKGQFTQNPSFDKHALKEYYRYPGAPQEVIALIMDYRRLSTCLTFFIRPYQNLEKANVLHGLYQQTVRTGRMACKLPNKQQLNKFAKKFVHPHEGYGFLSIDASQVEFRIIVHYTKNAKCIATYQENPDTDFHTWVAEECRIPRAPAKNINFMLGYGGGKAKTVQMLEGNMELMAELRAECETDEEFHTRRTAHAHAVYRTYHNLLSELKEVSSAVTAAVYTRGWVENIYGRVRKLPTKLAWKGFNSLCQGSAADLMKDRLVAVYNALKGLDIHIVEIVHDEILFEVPVRILENEELREELLKSIVWILENPEPLRALRIPMRWSCSWALDSWFAAGLNAKTIDFTGWDPKSPRDVLSSGAFKGKQVTI